MSDQQRPEDEAGNEGKLERAGRDPTHARTDVQHEDRNDRENVAGDGQGSPGSPGSHQGDPDNENETAPFIITVIVSSNRRYFGNDAKFVLLDYNPEILIVEIDQDEYVVVELEVTIEDSYRPLFNLMKPYLVIEEKGATSNLRYIMKMINFLSNMLAPAETTVDIHVFPGAPERVVRSVRRLEEKLKNYKLPLLISLPVKVPPHSETGTYDVLDDARSTGMKLCVFFRRVQEILENRSGDLIECINELESFHPRALASLAVDGQMEKRASVVMDCLREIVKVQKRAGSAPLVLQDFHRLRYAVACFLLDSYTPPMEESDHLNLLYVARAMYRAVFLMPTAPEFKLYEY